MKNKLDLILELHPEEEFLMADGLQDAVIGYDERSMKLIYSVKKCIEILTKGMKITKKDLSKEEIADGMSLMDKAEIMAREYFDYNTKGSYMGEKTPIFCEDDFQ